MNWKHCLSTHLPLLLSNIIYAQVTYFDYTGGNQTYVVPAGVNAINVKMWGAGGGSGDNTNGGNGGGGAYVEGTLCVTPGETLTIIVGGGGARGTRNNGGAFNGTAAFGGGGVGRQEDRGGGNGGGRSAIRRGNTELATAGGGGGGGGSGSNSGNGSRYCGGGGGAVNGNGSRGGDRDGCGQGSGGCGGTPTGNQNCTNAPNGGQFFGGDGENIGNTTYGGAGGGGGYYGGEGGNSGGNNSGGGGGGSSFFSGTLISSVAGNSGTNFTAGNAADPDNNFAYGGGGSRGSSSADNTGSNGQNGRVVISTITSSSLGPINGTPSVCVNATTQLSNNTPGGTWSTSNAGVATVNNSGLVSGISPGQATITYTVTGTCGSNSVDILVTVTGPPTVQPITGSPTACVSGTTQLSNATPGGTWSSSDNGIATVSPSGLVTGVSVGAVTISYTVTGSCGSTTVTQQVNITTTPTLPAITGTPNVCVNATTQLSNTTSGGTWSSSDNTIASVNPSTGLVTGISPGTATITYSVTSSCGTATTTQQVTVIGPPSVQPITGGNSVCVNGTLQLNNTTGGGVWTSSDINIASVNGAGTVTGISPGNVNINYAVTGTCGTTTVSQNITVNALPTVPAITGSTNVCAGATTQLANALPGGTWSSSNTNIATVNTSSGLVNGLAPGNVTITYTVSQNGCTGTNSAQVTVNPLPVVASAAATDVLCAGGANGSVVVSGSGGNPPYTYSIDNGQNFQNSGTFNGLAAGSYNVVISDAAGCSAAFAFNPVVINAPAAITQSNTVDNASCANVFDGKITVNASGGTPPYSYSLNGGAPQPSNIFSGLQSGTYSIQVIDANGCTNITTEQINTAFTVSASIVNQTNISCFGASDGSVQVQLSGGLPPYSYSINGFQFVSNPVFSGLGAGSYLITLRDSKGCTDFVNVNITQPPVLTVSINNITNVLCGGDSTGSISVAAGGGNAPYTFAWSNGGNSNSISNLKAGNYTVTVTDANNCTATRDATITQPLQLFAVVASYQDVQCAGDSSGYVDVSVSGGIPPYSFNWNTGATTEDIIKLADGVYTITVSDANNCTVVVTQTLSQPSPLSITALITNAACFGLTGNIDVSVSGGVQPYTYVWSNGATTQDVTNVPAGAYIVTVTDNNQCSKQLVNVVNQADEIIITASITNTSCDGGNIGAIDISVAGGSGNFTYQWSANAGSATTQDVNNLAAGTYSVTVTDGAQCSKTASFEVKATSNQLIIDLAEVDPVCYNGRNGFITVFVSGGTAPYSYTWSNGQTKNTASNLQSGVYTVTVKDAQGCEATASGEIKEPSKIDISILASGSKCKNIGTGEVNISVNGGVAPFTYQLNGIAQSSPNFKKLLPGSYSVLVRDANGCEATTSLEILQTTNYSVKLSSDKIVILSGMEAQLNAVAISDVPVLNYFWSPPGNYNFEGCADTLKCSNPKVAPSTTTIYTVTILNEDSCVATDTVLITVVREPSEFIPTAFTPNGDGLNDRFEFDILGATSAEVNIYNRWGSLVYSNSNQPNGITGNIGWDGTFKGKPLESETFVYTITVKYYNNIEKRFTGTIALLR